MNQKNLLISIILVLFLSSIVVAEWGYVSRVVDGDTFVLNNGSKVRLIGVDTPESKHPRKPVEYYSEEATIFLKNLIEYQNIYYEFGDERTDRYGRLLLYVWIGDIMVNQAIIETGHGMAYLKYPHKFENEFLGSEIYARRNGIGMWGSGISPSNTSLNAPSYSGSSYGTTSIHLIIDKYRKSNYSESEILEMCNKNYPEDSCKKWLSINTYIDKLKGLHCSDSAIFESCKNKFPEDSCKTYLGIE